MAKLQAQTLATELLIKKKCNETQIYNRWFSEKNINHKYLEFESAHGINSENFEQMNLWLSKN